METFQEVLQGTCGLDCVSMQTANLANVGVRASPVPGSGIFGCQLPDVVRLMAENSQNCCPPVSHSKPFSNRCDCLCPVLDALFSGDSQA